MSGGFGLCGIAENCISALHESDVKDLTVISNNIGNSGRSLAVLLQKKQINKAYCSYVGGNPDLESQILSGEVDVELVPQGTFAERIRAAGMGIRAFFTPTGYGTTIAEGKETKTFDRPCILEHALHADFAIIRLREEIIMVICGLRRPLETSPLMAMAAKITVVEVEELVPLGTIPAEDVHLPGIFVQRIFEGIDYKNHIEFEILAEGEN